VPVVGLGMSHGFNVFSNKLVEYYWTIAVRRQTDESL